MPLPVMVWIGFSFLYCYTILLIFVIVGLVFSPVFVSIQLSFVRPHPVISIGRVWKSNPVTTVFVGWQKFRFYEIIFFARFNLYQTGIPFFAFLLRVFPSFTWREQFITQPPVANPPLLTSWVKNNRKKKTKDIKLVETVVITEGYGVRSTTIEGQNVLLQRCALR